METKIVRKWAMPNKNTFSIKPIENLIQKYLKGKWIDPFANDSIFKDKLIECSKAPYPPAIIP